MIQYGEGLITDNLVPIAAFLGFFLALRVLFFIFGWYVSVRRAVAFSEAVEARRATNDARDTMLGR